MKTLLLIFPLLALPMIAAARPNEITLACSGTIKMGDEEPRSLKDMSIALNLDTKKVHGFVSVVGGVDIKIFEETFISFDSPDSTISKYRRLHGELDRITGNLAATIESETKNGGVFKEIFNLTCVPKRRIF
jgi:hypothetical protein